MLGIYKPSHGVPTVSSPAPINLMKNQCLLLRGQYSVHILRRIQPVPSCDLRKLGFRRVGDAKLSRDVLYSPPSPLAVGGPLPPRPPLRTRAVRPTTGIAAAEPRAEYRAPQHILCTPSHSAHYLTRTQRKRTTIPQNKHRVTNTQLQSAT